MPLTDEQRRWFSDLRGTSLTQVSGPGTSPRVTNPTPDGLPSTGVAAGPAAPPIRPGQKGQPTFAIPQVPPSNTPPAHVDPAPPPFLPPMDDEPDARSPGLYESAARRGVHRAEQMVASVATELVSEASSVAHSAAAHPLAAVAGVAAAGVLAPLTMAVAAVGTVGLLGGTLVAAGLSAVEGAKEVFDEAEAEENAPITGSVATTVDGAPPPAAVSGGDGGQPAASPLAAVESAAGSVVSAVTSFFGGADEE